MTASQNRTSERALARDSRCVLRRRQPRVVVRAPEAPPSSIPKIRPERRARVTTLIGIGAREAMPTLFDIDIDDFDNQPTHPGINTLGNEPELDSDVSLALEAWNDDEEETCFDL